jgi:hypothetical protein
MVVAPGHAHLPAIKILHHDKILAPRQFVPRHCASANLPDSSNRDNFPATYQICTATHVMLNQLCTLTAKTHAIPSLHRDSFAAKVPGLCPVLASGNVPPRQAGSIAKTAHWAVSIRSAPLYCPAVMWHSSPKRQDFSALDNFSLTSKFYPFIRTPPSIIFTLTRPACPNAPCTL